MRSRINWGKLGKNLSGKVGEIGVMWIGKVGKLRRG